MARLAGRWPRPPPHSSSSSSSTAIKNGRARARQLQLLSNRSVDAWERERERDSLTGDRLGEGSSSKGWRRWSCTGCRCRPTWCAWPPCSTRRASNSRSSPSTSPPAPTSSPTSSPSTSVSPPPSCFRSATSFALCACLIILLLLLLVLVPNSPSARSRLSSTETKSSTVNSPFTHSVFYWHNNSWYRLIMIMNRITRSRSRNSIFLFFLPIFKYWTLSLLSVDHLDFVWRTWLILPWTWWMDAHVKSSH